jgi:Kef-type K+ transport system membrane component KefB
MKTLKILWVISLIIILFFTGCVLFDLLPINDLEFEYYGMVISIIAFYVICLLYENKKVKEQGYNDKKIFKLLIVNILLMIIYIMCYILTRDVNVVNDSKFLYYFSYYKAIYAILFFPLFASKYIAYFSKGKIWLNIIGIILFIISFFIIMKLPVRGISI